MTENKTDLPEIKGGAPMSRQAMFSKIASRAEYIIEELFKDCQSDVPPVRVAALKTLINKILPDLKATELTGAEGKDLFRIVLERSIPHPNEIENRTSILTPDGKTA